MGKEQIVTICVSWRTNNMFKRATKKDIRKFIGHSPNIVSDPPKSILWVQLQVMGCAGGAFSSVTELSRGKI